MMKMVDVGRDALQFSPKKIEIFFVDVVGFLCRFEMMLELFGLGMLRAERLDKLI